MNKFLTLMLLLGCTLTALAAEPIDPKYLAGAVPETDGMVIYTKDFSVPDRSAADIYADLKEYTQTCLVEGPDHGEQARITQDTPEEGVLCASIHETLWFLRKPMRSDLAQFYYQIIFEVRDGGFRATMRALRYLYNFSGKENDDTPLRAEEWITDKQALAKGGTKLTRTNGKFRRATIDRKDEIMRNAGRAAGAKAKTPKRTIVVEEDY